MQPKFNSHKTVRITLDKKSMKVKVKDFGGNETTKDLQQFNGIAGKVRNQVVGPSIAWQETQWFYDIETEDGSRIHKIPEICLEEAITA
jgi:hypothetical protein